MAVAVWKCHLIIRNSFKVFNFFVSWSLTKSHHYFSVVNQAYETNVNQQYVIMGNDVILKCDIPSFVADFVQVVSWHDNKGSTVMSSSSYGNFLFPVISQDFKAHVSQESYVILGNDAILKCDIPSFVADLVTVASWHDSQGNVFLPSTDGKWGFSLGALD